MIASVDMIGISFDVPQTDKVECELLPRSDCIEIVFRRWGEDGKWPSVSEVRYQFSVNGEKLDVVKREWSQTRNHGCTTSGTSVTQWNDRLPK